MFTTAHIIIRLISAFILGGLIGLEREIHGRAAGLRTHILVCLGSALLMLTSMHIFYLYRDVTTIDPGRIAAGVITGIGFLGAGTILRFKASVRGLTTAASLWAVAGIGLAVGSGFYLGAYATSALVLFVLFFLTKLERVLVRKDWYRVLAVETKGGAQQLQDIRSALSDYKAEIRDFEIKKKPDSDNVIMELNLKLITARQDDQILTDIMRIRGVEKAGWQEL
ncbi:MAG: MgtC/SapB family protein [Candidatus Omnitrophica bacterium]|nr:MgtC/SapB family protein [Candidatus Omnitrophota bacterium]MBU4141137.1 MgtC/SapB family protein [Candidatus Omnitrophota bacterium]